MTTNYVRFDGFSLFDKFTCYQFYEFEFSAGGGLTLRPKKSSLPHGEDRTKLSQGEQRVRNSWAKKVSIGYARLGLRANS